MANGLPAATARNVFLAFDRFTALAQMHMQREGTTGEQRRIVNDALANGHTVLRELRIASEKEKTSDESRSTD